MGVNEGTAISLASFTLLDWIVLSILLYSIVMSTLRGFVREVLGLGTVVVALLMAAWLHEELGSLFVNLFRTEDIALFLGFSIVFVVTLSAGFAAIRMIYKFFEFARLEWFDRLLGGAFGLVRGWLVGVIVFLGLTAFGIQSEAVRNSQLAPYFLPGARAVAAVTPFDLKARFLIGYEEVQRWWSESL